MKENIIVYTIFAYILFACVGLIWGVLSQGIEKECTYETIAGRANIGYIAGCELFRPRF